MGATKSQTPIDFVVKLNMCVFFPLRNYYISYELKGLATCSSGEAHSAKCSYWELKIRKRIRGAM